MTRPPYIDVALRDRHLAREPLLTELLAGLRERPKRISPTYFYDARGSQLFDRICALPEYYLTRTETWILETHAQDIADRLGDNALLVEFGSGSSVKTRVLLRQLRDLCAYVPVEISRSHLLEAARAIAATYPHLEILPVCADFTLPFDLPKPRRAPSRTVIFFPGSTIGNFDPPAAVELMRLMRNVAGPHGGLVVGADLLKDPVRLHRAYNDAAGVTAEFNLNVLRRLNREFGAGFDLDGFSHDAIWNAAQARIEMHLVSGRVQCVTIAGAAVRFAAGERVVTEHSHKYTLESFRQLAANAGWRARDAWLDDRRDFSVHYLEALQ